MNSCSSTVPNTFNTEARPVRVTEIEFGQIPLQVRFRDVLINAIDAPLEDGKVAFDGIGEGIAPHVFLGGMIDGLVVGERAPDRGIDQRLIAHKPAVRMGMAGDDGIEVVRGHVRNVEAADFAIALDQGHDGLLDRDGCEGPVLRFAADVGFVSFDSRTTAAHLRREQGGHFLHSLPDAMAEEPSGFHAAAEGPLKLAGADTLLAAAHQVDGLQPDVQRDMTGLEDGPHTDGEGLAARIALVQAGTGGLTLQAPNPDAALAVSANWPVRPQLCFDICERGDFAVELRGGQCGLHGWLLLDHQPTRRQWVCQV